MNLRDIKRAGILAFLLVVNYSTCAQESTVEKPDNFWSRIFLPSIDVGLQVPTSDLIGNSVRIGTSIEYRFRNNNDFFFRLNYDTYNASYQLANQNNTTNTIEGKVQFTDFASGFGYRFGDRTYRLMLAAIPGIKTYEFPTATVNGQQVIVRSEAKSVFTTIFLATLEYYIDEKSAVTFSLYHNQVYRETDFWVDGGAAFGFSIGFITSLL